MSYKTKRFWDRLLGMIVKHLTRKLLSRHVGENLVKTLPVCNKCP